MRIAAPAMGRTLWRWWRYQVAGVVAQQIGDLLDAGATVEERARGALRASAAVRG
jgi:hypothetical protein